VTASCPIISTGFSFIHLASLLLPKGIVHAVLGLLWKRCLLVIVEIVRVNVEVVDHSRVQREHRVKPAAEVFVDRPGCEQFFGAYRPPLAEATVAIVQPR